MGGAGEGNRTLVCSLGIWTFSNIINMLGVKLPQTDPNTSMSYKSDVKLIAPA